LHNLTSQPTAGAAASTSRRVKSLDRWDYWLIPAINPWRIEKHPGGRTSEEWADIASAAAHEHLERVHGDAHRAGDPEAIFEYARADAWCFRSTWFVEQLETWRDEGQNGQLRKTMGAFARNATKVPIEELKKLVARDQNIFRRLTQRQTGLSLNDWYGTLANEFDVSEETVRDIDRAYRPYFESETTAGVSTNEFFDRLAEMLKRFP
jgi:hypothetical protein